LLSSWHNSYLFHHSKKSKFIINLLLLLEFLKLVPLYLIFLAIYWFIQPCNSVNFLPVSACRPILFFVTHNYNCCIFLICDLVKFCFANSRDNSTSFSVSTKKLVNQGNTIYHRYISRKLISLKCFSILPSDHHLF
jgi:hypothetical protein